MQRRFTGSPTEASLVRGTGVDLGADVPAGDTAVPYPGDFGEGQEG